MAACLQVRLSHSPTGARKSTKPGARLLPCSDRADPIVSNRGFG